MCRAFNDTLEGNEWATCSLRNYLNGEFIRKNFDEKEQHLIQETTLEIQINHQDSFQNKQIDIILENKFSGNDMENNNMSVLQKIAIKNRIESEKVISITNDKVFLLPYHMASYYKQKGILTQYSESSNDWWLCTPGTINNSVLAAGKFDPILWPEGHLVNDNNIGVRPVMSISTRI